MAQQPLRAARHQWNGIPEGKDYYTPRQQKLLKWRVRDVIYDKTSKTDPSKEGSIGSRSSVSDLSVRLNKPDLCT
jgi:hypothetical protein